MSDHSNHSRQHGSVLIILLVMMVGAGSMAMAHLTKVIAESKKVRARVHSERATAAAVSNLEFAKNVVNAAPYLNQENTALLAAVRSNPPFIPGTTVEVQRVGSPTSDWFMLRATGFYQGIAKKAQAFVRQRSPVSSYNFFVIDHPLGISGAPRGAIHSNKSIDFYFPWGLYRDQVTAGEGFNYKAGATPENTVLSGSYDPQAATSNILEDVSIGDLADKADTLKVTDNLIAEVDFKGANTEVRLFSPGHTMQVEHVGTRSVFDHYEDVPVEVQEPVYVTEYYDEEVPIYEDEPYYVTRTRNHYTYYEVTKTRMESVYENRTVTWVETVPVYETRTVTVEKEKQVWVENPPPTLEELEGGYAVGGSEPELGHWETISYLATEEEQYVSGHVEETRSRVDKVKVGEVEVEYTDTEKVLDWVEEYEKLKYRQVQVGTETVTKSRNVFSHYETVTEVTRKPIYRDEEYTYFEEIHVPEELVSTETVPTSGLIYIEGEIRSIKGEVNGQVSLVTNSKAVITDSITYVDNNGEKRMLNGTNPDEKYSFNPNYTGESVLGIMSQGDIHYSLDAPQKMEINASLISLDGMVSFESITVSDDGETVSMSHGLGSDPADHVKESIRRLGGVVSRKRPVTTYVNGSNEVLAGFKKGISFMDRNMILEGGGNIAPPFVFQVDRPSWALASAGRLFNPGS